MFGLKLYYYLFELKLKFSLSANTSQFTQLIWKNTNSAGFGLATGYNAYYCLAQFSPIGNLAGSFYVNVNPLNVTAKKILLKNLSAKTIQ